MYIYVYSIVCSLFLKCYPCQCLTNHSSLVDEMRSKTVDTYIHTTQDSNFFISISLSLTLMEEFKLNLHNDVRFCRKSVSCLAITGDDVNALAGDTHIDLISNEVLSYAELLTLLLKTKDTEFVAKTDPHTHKIVAMISSPGCRRVILCRLKIHTPKKQIHTP